MITSVRIAGDRVCIDSGSECFYLTFADVKVAAEVLREHLLAALPPEVPAGDPGAHWHRAAPGVLQLMQGPPCLGDPGYVKP